VLQIQQIVEVSGCVVAIVDGELWELLLDSRDGDARVASLRRIHLKFDERARSASRRAQVSFAQFVVPDP